MMRNALQLLLASAIGLTSQSATARESSPYSLIAGRLVNQEDTGLEPECDPDKELCMDVIMETTLRDIETIAGRPIGNNVSARHVFHAAYQKRMRGRLVILMVVWKSKDGRYHGVLVGDSGNRGTCVDESWFDPSKNGMKIPKGYKANSDGDVCLTM